LPGGDAVSQYKDHFSAIGDVPMARHRTMELIRSIKVRSFKHDFRRMLLLTTAIRRCLP
jgi:hypothetical protein